MLMTLINLFYNLSKIVELYFTIGAAIINGVFALIFGLNAMKLLNISITPTMLLKVLYVILSMADPN